MNIEMNDMRDNVTILRRNSILRRSERITRAFKFIPVLRSDVRSRRSIPTNHYHVEPE